MSVIPNPDIYPPTYRPPIDRRFELREEPPIIGSTTGGPLMAYILILLLFLGLILIKRWL